MSKAQCSKHGFSAAGRQRPRLEASISRAMTEITEKQHQETVQRFKKIYSTYEQNRDLISVGAYQNGADARIDEAIGYYPRLTDYLQQDMHQSVTLEESLAQLDALIAT